MKTYEGKRTIDGLRVTVDGRPLPEHYEVKKFTSYGFEWTYEGESPQQLALAILAASRQLPLDRLASHAALGELALDGRVRPVRGAIVAAEAALQAGLGKLLCAAESAAEAALGGVEPIPIRHLAEATAYLRGRAEPEPVAMPQPSTAALVPDLRAPRKLQRLPHVLSRDEVARLLAAPRGTEPAALRDRALLELMYACGLRASEATGLHVGDLDLEAGVLRARGKGSKERLVPIGREATSAVKAYLESHGIAGSRINSVGHGEESPVASNDTPEGRAENRRVEITLDRAGALPERQPVKGIDPEPMQLSKPK